jgi:hypothetical protein
MRFSNEGSKMKSARLCLALIGTAFLMGTAAVKAEEMMQATPEEEVVINKLQEMVPKLWKLPVLLRQVIIGFEISPVPLDLTNKDPILVGLGSYIVNGQAGCNDCHTNPSYEPNGDPFKGEKKKVSSAVYLGGGQIFGPAIVSRNLTPEDGLPAGRTFEQFKQEIRTGLDLDHAHPQYGPLLQVMPWPSYQAMTDTDLLAIYTFLSAIPPVSVPN